MLTMILVYKCINNCITVHWNVQLNVIERDMKSSHHRLFSHCVPLEHIFADNLQCQFGPEPDTNKSVDA